MSNEQKSEITLQIETMGDEDILPLYTECQGQEGKAYLYLDTRDGFVSLGCKQPWNNGVSSEQFAGHVRSWEVPNNLTAAGCNELFADPAVTDRLKRVVAGALEYFDGGNTRTKLSDDARDASDELESYLHIQIYGSQYDTLEARSADDFLMLVGYSDCVKRGEDPEDAAERIVEKARSEGYYLTVADVINVLAKKKGRIDDVTV